jgi:cyclopropane fatty-acyl-phospholipid synthase-like methyltransferase
MPSSYADSIPGIVHSMIDAAPGTVMDVGPGWGKYGLMAREYLPALRVLSALEVPEGRKDIQEAIYDIVITADVRELEAAFWLDLPFDLVMMIDVIEHFTEEDGHRILDEILASDAKVLVSTPKEWFDQIEDAERLGNPHERHLSLWTWEMLIQHGTVLVDRSTDSSIIYLLER